VSLAFDLMQVFVRLTSLWSFNGTFPQQISLNFRVLNVGLRFWRLSDGACADAILASRRL